MTEADPQAQAADLETNPQRVRAIPTITRETWRR